MANLLIIGAGGVGSVVAHKCAQAAKESGAFDKIVLASRTLARCRAIAGSVKERLGVDLEIAEVDADNVPQLCELIRRAKSDLVCRRKRGQEWQNSIGHLHRQETRCAEGFNLHFNLQEG